MQYENFEHRPYLVARSESGLITTVCFSFFLHAERTVCMAP